MFQQAATVTPLIILRYMAKARLCSATSLFTTPRDLLCSTTAFKHTSFAVAHTATHRSLVTGTQAQAHILTQLHALYSAKQKGRIVHFNATLALKHTSVSHVEPFDTIIHLVSHPLASIESLSKVSPHELDELLPQSFAAANQTALHRAMVHWVAVNSLLEMFADTRVRVEDLGADIPQTAAFLLDISAADRQTIASSQPRPSLTWKDLRDEDSDLAALVCRTGERYGYECVGS